MEVRARAIAMTVIVLVFACLVPLKVDAGAARGGWTLADGTLRLDGAITAGDRALFRTLFIQALLQVPHPAPVVVELNSRGGQLRAALEIVHAIGAARREGTRMVTVVGPGARCFSACVLLFAAGDVRRAAPGALFLFHGLRRRGQATPIAGDGQAIARFLAVIATADSGLAAFLREARVLEDDVEVAFPAGLLMQRFPGFVTERD